MWANKKKTVGPTSEMQVIRKKQIDTLKKDVGSLTEVEKDVQYEVVVAPGSDVRLLVVLPPLFPDEAPHIAVTPSPVSHAWVNSNNVVVGHPKLSQWTPQSSLAKVVKETIEEFKRTPPQVLQSSLYPSIPDVQFYTGTDPSRVPTLAPPARPAPIAHAPAPSVVPHASAAAVPVAHTAVPPVRFPVAHHQAQPQQHQPAAQPVPPPAALWTGIHPELENKPDEVLQVLLADGSELEKLMLFEMDLFRDLKAKQETVRKANEKLAIANIEGESKMVAVQSQASEQFDLLSAQRMEYNDQLGQLQQYSKKYSPETIIGKLRRNIQELENNSEDVAASFLRSPGDPDEFVRKFMEQRKRFHSDSAKLERVLADPSVLTFVPK